MRLSSLALLAALLVTTPTAVLADVTLPLSPFAAFLRLDPTDTAGPALIIRLSDHGIVPGTSLHLAPIGDFDNGPGGDQYAIIFAVFSANDTLLDGSLLHRVPGAIGAGVTTNSGSTCPSNVPNDIPEDFFANESGVDVTVPPGATHLFVSTADCYFVDNSDPDGDYAVRLTFTTTGVADAPGAGGGLALLAPWPNPAGSRVALPFTLPAPGRARLSVHAADGRRVRTLLDGMRGAGRHDPTWDARDERGERVPAGVYFVRLATDAGKAEQKVVVGR